MDNLSYFTELEQKPNTVGPQWSDQVYPALYSDNLTYFMELEQKLNTVGHYCCFIRCTQLFTVAVLLIWWNWSRNCTQSATTTAVWSGVPSLLQTHQQSYLLDGIGTETKQSATTAGDQEHTVLYTNTVAIVLTRWNWNRNWTKSATTAVWAGSQWQSYLLDGI